MTKFLECWLSLRRSVVVVAAAAAAVTELD
jgi:hypothetical protein